MMIRKPHDSFFRWLFAIVAHLHSLLKLAEKFNCEIAEFLKAVNLDTLVPPCSFLKRTYPSPMQKNS